MHVPYPHPPFFLKSFFHFLLLSKTWFSSGDTTILKTHSLTVCLSPRANGETDTFLIFPLPLLAQPWAQLLMLISFYSGHQEPGCSFPFYVASAVITLDDLNTCFDDTLILFHSSSMTPHPNYHYL